MRYHAPPLTLDERQRADAEASALAACRALGCRDIARVDLRFDAAGEANLVEVNPIPGLNPVSSDLVIMNGLLEVVPSADRADPRCCAETAVSGG